MGTAYVRFPRLVILLGGAAVATAPVLASETITYTYDSSGRLIQIVHTGTVNNGINSSYCYDRADNRANVNVANGAGSSTPAFSISNASATEGDVVVFTVTKCPLAAASLSVDFATSNGGAIAGSDFAATSGTLNFLSAETSKTISVTTINDATHESAETFTVTLSNPSAGSTVGTATGAGTINDND